ncbi:MAG: RNA ligase family protein [Azospirillum sp.]|nr:RNA ligase family protein [Azospirillum sp.]
MRKPPAQPKLLTRDEFRRSVFARAGGKCVCCDAPAVDAHHILERRLWPDGGYYLENGAAVCEEHHLACERTTISVEEIRERAGILKPFVPPHLYPDQPYDKWGNPVLPNGTRMRGELFDDASVQKVLGEGGVLGLFTDRVKYPRTWHLPMSPGATEDDKKLDGEAVKSAFAGKRVVITEKMDGENTTIYRDYMHTRSLDSRHHESRDWVKNFAATMQHDIPEGWRVCVENLYAKHSIGYDALPSYVLGFSIWNERNEALSWDETVEWFRLLGIEPVSVLFDGSWEEAQTKIADLAARDRDRHEGFVVRTAEGFHYRDFTRHVAKWVREGHVVTSHNWARQAVVPNGLAEPEDISSSRRRMSP